MTIQQTIQSLTKDLSHHDADEIESLIQEWPVNDQEFQDLLETHTGEILRLFQQAQPSPQSDQSANRTTTKDPLDGWVTQPLGSDFGAFPSTAALN